MKKLYILFASVLFAVSMSAQDGEMRGVMNTDSFPQVSFLWHQYNPQPIYATAFSLKEDGQLVECKVEQVKDTLGENAYRRTVIILWEDMYCNGNMYDFSRKVLDNFIDAVSIRPGIDNIYIAAFNRHTNSERVLKPVTTGFLSTPAELHNAVGLYNRSTAVFKELPNQSDVYPAVLEALEIFKKRGEIENEVRGIFVITAGRPLESSATNSAVEVQKQAKAAHVPLYMFQYAVSHGKSTVLEGLGNDTYGKSEVFSSTYQNLNVEYATTALSIAYRYLYRHYNGQNYLVSFQSNHERGSKEVALELRVDGQVYALTLLTPKHTFITWCFKNWYICAGVIAVLLALIIWLSVVSARRARLSAADAATIGKLRAEQAQTQKKIDEQNAKLEQYKAEKGQQIIINSQQSKHNHKEEMQDLMEKKNMFPRIQYMDKEGNPKVYEMHQIEIKIGRGAKADIRFDNNSVSREHAIIRFVGSGFEIEDTNSTNGIVVSGKPVQKTAPLHDHDVINLGTELLTFYL